MQTIIFIKFQNKSIHILLPNFVELLGNIFYYSKNYFTK